MDWNLGRRWRSLAAIPLVLVSLTVFFVIYNHLMVDLNLTGLKLSLKALARPGTISTAEAAMALIDQNLLYTVSIQEANSVDLAALQYAAGALASDPGRQVEDVQAMVSTVVNRRITSRQGLILTLDELNEAIGEALQRALLMPRVVLQRGRLSDEIDLARLQQASQSERLGDFRGAEESYQALLRDFPSFSGRDDLKLRLGYLYQRQRAFVGAERLYREVLGATKDPISAGIARQLLLQLEVARRASQDVAQLQERLRQAQRADERQQVAFDLGAKQMRLFDFDGAIESFQIAAKAQPNAPLAPHARFRWAWCLKYIGRYDEALGILQDLVRETSTPDLSANANVQIADAYRALGQYEAAAEALEAAVRQAQDMALASLLIAQAGSTFLVDLKKPEVAEQYFRRVQQQFPGSPMSAIQQTIEQLQADKALALVEAERAGAGIPVMRWFEISIPSVTEMMSMRVADYLRDAGEAEWRRTVSELEFTQQLLPRIRQQFPNQVREIELKLAGDGLRFTASVRIGALWFPVEGLCQFGVVRERIHIKVPELSIGRMAIPGPLRQILADRVNEGMDKAALALEIRRFDVTSGGIDLEVALAQ